MLYDTSEDHEWILEVHGKGGDERKKAEQVYCLSLKVKKQARYNQINGTREKERKKERKKNSKSKKRQ